MTGDMEEWFPAGTILYTETHDIPRIKIITKDHTYEMQASKFDPIMQVFSVLVDGTFQPSRYDSLERLLKLDEVSKSNLCSEREELLMIQVRALKKQLKVITRELANFKLKHNDERMIMFSGE
jgi:hypothetical protein